MPAISMRAPAAAATSGKGASALWRWMRPISALRYVALNPVRARLVEHARDWRRSSVHAHLAGCEDGVTSIAPVLDRYPGFAELIEAAPDEAAFERLRRAASIGRPLGEDSFITRLETLTPRTLKPGKRGPKPSRADEPGQTELSGVSL